MDGDAVNAGGISVCGRLAGALLGGEEVGVVFDETGDKFDDEVYGGVGDPMGRLKGGETYRVVYGGGRTRTMGHDQATGQEGMEDEENGMIDGGRLVLWGEAFEVSEGGEVRDSVGRLVGHLSSGTGSNETGWVIVGDANRNGVQETGEVWETEAQRTWSRTENLYAVIVGQAVVTRSETTSYACDDAGTAMKDKTLHGYNKTVMTLENRYNEKGQLEGVTGGSVGESNVKVKSPVWVGDAISGDDGDGFKEDGEPWVYEWVDQMTETETKNEYAVILGQGVVTKSETESWAVKGGVRITDEGARGYSHSETTVLNEYNGRGQLIGGTGVTAGRTNGGGVRTAELNELGTGIKGTITATGSKRRGRCGCSRRRAAERVFWEEHVSGDTGAGGDGEECDGELGVGLWWESYR
ncbi:MAG: hypothetical protein IPN90_13345 [Elusimicrobia bacterium]|nr:hypothetical protein [Elusimicrobiota bacterium]